MNIEERTNWTDEEDTEDSVGHGTHVASVIAARAEGCHGLAPDATLHVYKVFNSRQVSFTSWFLDAFEHLLRSGNVHIVNLSIGGPDFSDEPFLRSVDEIVARNIVVVSGIGNSGPLWGTLMNPADQPDVIGVGGVDQEGKLGDFSSRGMTAWELPDGYGRVKPDVLTYGSHVLGLSLSGGCRALSGTSVACPVVAGAVALLASIVPEPRRWQLLNPAVFKQVLTRSAHRLRSRSAYEQGAGVMDLLGAAQLLTDYVAQVSVLPPQLDLSPCTPRGEPIRDQDGGDGYLWPHCAQPIFHGALPLVLNLTVLNGLALTSLISTRPSFTAARDDLQGYVSIAFDYPSRLWPWGGALGVALQATELAAGFDGTVAGEIRFQLLALDGINSGGTSDVVVPLKVRVVPPPPRSRRLLYDQAHSVPYPPAYVPRDNLAVTDEMLDWAGDHLHTNMRDLFIWLREEGFFVETVGCAFTSFNASRYAALLLVDAEAEFSSLESRKLRHDIIGSGMSLIVLADWYNTAVMDAVRFYDENSHSWWTPITGGANVPALNKLLAPFGVAFGDTVLRGDFLLGDGHVQQLASAAPLVRFPVGGWLVRARSLIDQGAKLTGGPFSFTRTRRDVPILGLLQPQASGAGRIAAFGDSDCVDTAL